LLGAHQDETWINCTTSQTHDGKCLLQTPVGQRALVPTLGKNKTSGYRSCLAATAEAEEAAAGAANLEGNAGSVVTTTISATYRYLWSKLQTCLRETILLRTIPPNSCALIDE